MPLSRIRGRLLPILPPYREARGGRGPTDNGPGGTLNSKLRVIIQARNTGISWSDAGSKGRAAGLRSLAGEESSTVPDFFFQNKPTKLLKTLGSVPKSDKTNPILGLSPCHLGPGPAHFMLPGEESSATPHSFLQDKPTKLLKKLGSVPKSDKTNPMTGSAGQSPEMKIRRMGRHRRINDIHEFSEESQCWDAIWVVGQRPNARSKNPEARSREPGARCGWN